MNKFKEFKKITKCRTCNSKNLIGYLDLGQMPLANGFLKKNEIRNEKRFPLEVILCKDCYFSQLSVVVDPELLFRNYSYCSRHSKTFKIHCQELAEELNKKILQKDELVVDIASNDGSLLKFFKKKGNKVLGVDPARNLARKANRAGIETIAEFWSDKFAKELLPKKGKAKVITAFNVFAHVDDMHSFVKGAKTILDENGYLIIESPHILPMLCNTEFDTIYHEHLSYLSLKPLEKLMSSHGLRIAKVKKFDIHGGSIRMYIEHEHKNTSDGSLEKVIREETTHNVYSLRYYHKFQSQVDKIRQDLVDTLLKLKQQGKMISAFGASAKGNTLLNYCKIDNITIDWIFDRTLEKQNRLYAGVHIPIIDPSNIEKIKPDYLLLLAWNFAPELMSKTVSHQKRGGKYIIPVPKVKVI